MADNLGLVTRLEPNRKPPEVSLDTALADDHGKRSSELIGYALLAVTFVLAIVILWPFLSARFGA